MLSEKDAKHILRECLRLSPAEGTEAALSGGNVSLVRFVENEIVLPFNEKREQLFLRVLDKGRIGRASVDRFDGRAIKAALNLALKAARAQPLLREKYSFPPPRKILDVNGYDSPSAQLSVEEMMLKISGLLELFRKKGIRGYGVLSKKTGSINASYGWPFGGERMNAIANSEGLFAYHKSTALHFSVTLKTQEAEAWHEVSGLKISGMDFKRIGEDSVKKVLAAKKLQVLDPGDHTVIFEPAAVAAMLSGIGKMFLAESAARPSSPFFGKLGERIFGTNITLSDDHTNSLLQNCPFSSEGVPRRKKILISEGRVNDLIYSKREAQEKGMEPDGYDLPFPGLAGRGHYDEDKPVSLCLAGGKSSMQELIASSKKAVVVTGFWGNIANEGSLLVRNGKVTGALKGFYIKQDALQLLRNAELLGRQERISNSFFTSVSAFPAIKASGVKCSI